LGFGLISIEIDIEVGHVVVVNDETERVFEIELEAEIEAGLRLRVLLCWGGVGASRGSDCD
jgi:hypothetical protein